MKIWVRAGEGFHAGHELESWLRQRIDHDHTTAVIGCVYKLMDIRTTGFAAGRASWQRAGYAEVWTFRTFDFLLAARVPGDGRSETYDACLIASGRTYGRDPEAAKPFHDLVKWRLASGYDLEWEL